LIDLTDLLIALGIAIAITGLAFINPYSIIVLVGLIVTLVGLNRRT
jgi:hypothetical protein